MEHKVGQILKYLGRKVHIIQIVEITTREIITKIVKSEYPDCFYGELVHWRVPDEIEDLLDEYALIDTEMARLLYGI